MVLRVYLLPSPLESIVQEQTADTEKVYTAVEQMPNFPGGEAELMKYISDNIKYPAEIEMQGRVVVKFVVTKTGKVVEVEVVRGRHPLFDAEAVRVIKTLPDFIPGKMNGKPVNVWYTLPVSFKLTGK
ncbi:TonB family protein [uncultured Muribaculum sp.]|uniref:TonB family protein n=1 Tax=uncultured Muribaculum sp. TaxID=1918613 RepID=UPI0025EDEE49|nr:TonB family protein [uncultured Muribaculum sp.]